MTIADMQAQLDEIAAITSCWRPSRRCEGGPTCACVPTFAAIVQARRVARALPVPLRWYPTVEGGCRAECFDDPPTIEFRGQPVRAIVVDRDGAVEAFEP